MRLAASLIWLPRGLISGVMTGIVVATLSRLRPWLLPEQVGTIAALSVIVAIHEYGHYIVGRWSGIHAEVFSLGFGPVHWELYSEQGPAPGSPTGPTRTGMRHSDSVSGYVRATWSASVSFT